MKFMVKCCECDRIRVEGQWIPEPQKGREGHVYSHSYCPDCLRRIMAQIEAWTPEPVATGAALHELAVSAVGGT